MLGRGWARPVVLVVVVVMAAGAVGCGGDDPPERTQAAQPAQPPPTPEPSPSVPEPVEDEGPQACLTESDGDQVVLKAEEGSVECGEARSVLAEWDERAPTEGQGNHAALQMGEWGCIAASPTEKPRIASCENDGERVTFLALIPDEADLALEAAGDNAPLQSIDGDAPGAFDLVEETVGPEESEMFDVNGDGVVNAADFDADGDGQVDSAELGTEASAPERPRGPTVCVNLFGTTYCVEDRTGGPSSGGSSTPGSANYHYYRPSPNYGPGIYRGDQSLATPVVP